MTEASYISRPPSPDDPVVCTACGGTLGLRWLLAKLSDEQRAVRIAAHEQECQRRRDHQVKHRTIPGPCVECRGGT